MENNYSKIKYLRKIIAKRYSALLGITERHYRLCESGGVDLPTSKITTLANFFNVSIDFIVGRTENSEINK